MCASFSVIKYALFFLNVNLCALQYHQGWFVKYCFRVARTYDDLLDLTWISVGG